MNLLYSTGNEIVDEVSKINISGNIIPLSWFQTLVSESGKPMLLAIYLLADIVYWYRPKEIRDEESGNLVGYQKRFKADLLQRSYRQIENRFGVTKKQARTALNFLCEKGVIIKHLRDEKTAEGIMLHNNMYLELVPDKLRELTFPQINEGVSFKAPPYALEGTTVSTVKADGDSQEVTTSTENTTNITTKDYINPIYADMDVIEKMKIYEDIIKENAQHPAPGGRHPRNVVQPQNQLEDRVNKRCRQAHFHTPAQGQNDNGRHGKQRNGASERRFVNFDKAQCCTERNHHGRFYQKNNFL